MKIAFHTLGCKVNQYESEAMARMFRERGHEIVGEREFADVYVINTCTVTAVADRKSRQYIRRMKKVNPESIVAVTGCYVQIDPDAVSKIEGVDIITGTNEKSTLPDYVEAFASERINGSKDDIYTDQTASDQTASDQTASDQTASGAAEEPQLHILDWQDLNTYDDMGLVTSAENRTRAYIKIQEGCNRFCSYCVIPYARGNIRSRNMEKIVEEAKRLIEAGYKELVLTGINTALYGMEGQPGRIPAGLSEEAASSADPEELYGVERVIAALDRLPGDFRIRLSSLEPAVVNAAYVERLMKYGRLCHHLHLSAQSGSDRILKAMNRPYDRSGYLEIVETVRRFDPHYGISTDLIVGFPGEKEADFADSVSLTEQCDFCRTHVFRYSRRPKTLAAEMKNQVSPQVRARRSDALQDAGAKAGASFCRKNLGQERTVLVEEYLPEMGAATGFSDNYIRVYVRCDEETGRKMLNTFRQVRLTETYRDGCLGLIL